ncbi:SMR family transporter [Olsenella sp. YH-ols2217]|uniref:SMR family transporter n=1 Tax=Kribbibacterium absianum TaxID=3044210 RepID=A0ABT6ZMK7_9ACTN|nr:MULTISPECIES: SMR family transporter [unclassified Olsenella]MDJ1122291.1 SMR family transporter [Olsenella sp. YH-ols2216]MDJ1130295.1 SMR family transporter [Olsenella sp. YH-ols2217]
MSWVVLVVSGCMEAVWATALDRVDGLSNIPAIVVFVLGLIASMGGLAFALRDLPVGTAYAVWVGIGAVATCVWSMATGAQPFSWPTVLFLAGIVGCVAGLKLTCVH